MILTLRVLFNPINREIQAEEGDNLLEKMREDGIHIEALCGGKGQCGKCKVILEKGNVKKISKEPDKFLSEQEIASGYYLACQVELYENCTFTVPTESRVINPQILLSAEFSINKPIPSVKKYFVEASKKVNLPLLLNKQIKLIDYSGIKPRISDDTYSKFHELEDKTPLLATISRTSSFPEIIDVKLGSKKEESYGLAIDIGTTTIVGILVNLNNGDIISQASTMNKQITYGEELVTRIAFAREPEGLEKLQTIAVESINEIISQLIRGKDVDPNNIIDITAGGNTVMNHLFSGLESSYLEEANVDVSRDPIIRKAKTLGLLVNPEAYVYCVPNVSRFLGGDAVGDVIAADMHKKKEISLLVDLGTNGEIIYGNDQWLFSCSCASGPAFEGEGVIHGMRGALGGIDHVKIDKSTKEAEVTVIGNIKPKGICGSGLIDLVAEMFDAGLIDFVGKFVPKSTPLVREGKWGWEYVVVPSERTSVGKDIVITQADLDYVVDSKAAACGAITVLMKKLKIGIKDVEHLYLAGAFGNYTNIENATRLGLFPEFPNADIKPIGNGSLSGAYATLMSMEKRKEAKEISNKMVYVDLIVDTEFIDEYSKALYLPGSKEYFPSLT